MRTPPRCLLAVVATMLLALGIAPAAAAATSVADASPGAPASAHVWRTSTPEPSPPPTTNPFIPEDRNLSDCVSAVPQPGCGSKARGGWRQTLVFVVIAIAIAFIGWRVVRIVRRNRAAVDAGEVEPSGRR